MVGKNRQIWRLAEANEWYTPRQYIDAARITMGSIDLDPASCAEANSIVGAARYYTASENGLAQPWAGCVFLNPPYLSLTGNAGQYPAWTRKLVDSYELGFVEQAILLIPVHPERRWFQPLYRYPICFCNHQASISSAWSWQGAYLPWLVLCVPRPASRGVCRAV